MCVFKGMELTEMTDGDKTRLSFWWKGEML